MKFGHVAMVCVLAGTVAACANAPEDTAPAQNDSGVVLRNLAAIDDRPGDADRYPIEGDLIPTPSDTASRYYLLRQRRAVGGNIVAIIKQQQGPRAAYARVELDCAAKQFHVLGIGDRRSKAETDIAYDGPLRSTEGLPLRQELSAFVCDKA